MNLGLFLSILSLSDDLVICNTVISLSISLFLFLLFKGEFKVSIFLVNFVKLLSYMSVIDLLVDFSFLPISFFSYHFLLDYYVSIFYWPSLLDCLFQFHSLLYIFLFLYLSCLTSFVLLPQKHYYLVFLFFLYFLSIPFFIIHFSLAIYIISFSCTMCIELGSRESKTIKNTFIFYNRKEDLRHPRKEAFGFVSSEHYVTN